MLRHGFPVRGLSFEWDYAQDYTPEQQVAYETMVADRYDVEPSYFADKYRMPVGERRETPALAMPKPEDPEDNRPPRSPKAPVQPETPFFD